MMIPVRISPHVLIEGLLTGIIFERVRSFEILFDKYYVAIICADVDTIPSHVLSSPMDLFAYTLSHDGSSSWFLSFE